MRDDRGYLEDILSAIQQIEKQVEKGRDAFLAEELIQVWMIHHIQIIGEAIGKLSEELKAKHPKVPWTAIKAMRNVLVHFYFGIRLEKVWEAVEQDVPALKAQIESILISLQSGN
ncbi:MAG: DUF86 domain-containing protein [Planctomycetota bacterium]|nr:DUF86 domain-containing protein [Planctomycetota bacterium]